jgi:hypothetical protein
VKDANFRVEKYPTYWSLGGSILVIGQRSMVIPGMSGISGSYMETFFKVNNFNPGTGIADKGKIRT